MTILPITCNEFLSVLDLVVSDALAGSTIELHYPYVHQHMQTCASCRTAYEEILDMLQREAAGHVIRAPDQLPPDPDVAGWSLDLSPAHPAPWEHLHCFIPQRHLNTLLTAPPPIPHPRRGATPGQLDWLLLADVIRRPPATIALQVGLQSHWSTPERIVLMADLSSDYPLPHPLEVNLIWGEQVLTMPVDESGRARFAGLPAALGYPPIANLTLTFTHVTDSVTGVARGRN